MKPKRRDEHRRSNAEMSAETKARILMAGIESLAELGYAGTTISEIAERVGLTRAALLYHFESKNALMVAVMNALYDEMASRFAAAAPAFLAPRERLLAVLDTMGNHASSTNQMALIELLLAARRDPGFRDEVALTVARREAVFDRAWGDLIESFPTASRLEVLRDLAVAALRGITIGRSLGGDDLRFDSQFAELRRLFVEATSE
ncbi:MULTISPECIES: TetR/AcrR family transcriptional regulator [Cupriavidus]|uniref:TetR/AcrR family transcriptional regulator n=1 Tax=Cupriavidus TaxID=106589 RepID=UPI001F3E37BB|nr:MULTISPECIES: TetR/AcrR family transcriptional regulator [Cupriavidus]MDF3884573.1 TetR family transcriptional regulator [Cupriavidus basilensis]